MLVTLAEMKDYLSISTSVDDTFLNSQISLISETISNYCGRSLESKSYIQTFYSSDYGNSKSELQLFNYPVTSIAEVKEDGVIRTDYRYHPSSGWLDSENGFFCGGKEQLVVTYTAGYLTTPGPIKSVVFSLVEERYNKKKSGVSLNFGSDVQSISIPGTISVAFDYSLNSNERKNSFGTILKDYLNVLDYYRSERTIGGMGKLAYVQE